MNNIILEEARLWLNKEQDGLDLNTSQEFKSWIQTSFVNKETFEEEQNFRHTLKNLPKNILSDLSIENKTEIRQDEFFNKIKKVSLSAAVFILILFSSYFGYAQYQASFEKAYITENKIYKKIELPDHTLLAMDKNSKIKVIYYKDRREVLLKQGKVLFDVASNKDRPFQIKINDTLVEVLGTKFEIQKFEKVVTISVEEGRVSIQHLFPNKSTLRTLAILHKSDSLDISNFGKITRREKINEKMIAVWEKEKLLFKQTKLKDVVNKFSQYLDYEVKIQNKKIALLPISGKFSINDFENLMKSLSIIHPINIRKVDKTFFIEKKL